MINRTFVVLAFAMFMATLGLGMVTPILPVHARSLGATGAQVGLTFSAFALTQVFISPWSGRLADRFGRKPFLIVGMLTYAAAAVGWLFSGSIEAVIGFRMLSGVGSALVFSMAGAYIGDMAPLGSEGRYMGVFGLFDFLGFGIGPLLGGVIRDQADIDTVFLAMALLFSAATLVILILLPRAVRQPGVAGQQARREVSGPASWAVVLRNRYMQALFAVRVATSASLGATFSFIAVFMEEDLLVSSTMVGLVLAAEQLAGGVLQPVVGVAADRLGRRLMIVVGATFVALGAVTPVLVASYWPIFVAYLIGIGAGGAVVNVASRAIEVEVGRRLGMATVMSLNSTAFAAGVLVGSLGGGAIAEIGTTQDAFLAAFIALVAGTLFFVVRTAGGGTALTETGLDEGRGEPAGGRVDA